MTRIELKMIVKECLLEILAEGLGGAMLTGVGKKPVSGISENRSQQPRKPSFNPALDRPVSTGRPVTTAMREAVQREAAGNPIMASILADTARTSLPEMLSHDSGGSHGISSVEQFNGSPEEVFGEDSAMRWADLAFMETTKKSA